MNPMTARHDALGLLVAVTILSSCSCTITEAGPPGLSRTGDKVRAMKAEGLPVEHQALLEKYVDAHLSGSGRAVDRVVDFGGLFDEIIGKMNANDLPDKSALMGGRKGWVSFQSGSTGFDPARPKVSLRPGGIKVLSHKRAGEQSVVLLRLLSPDVELPDYRTLIIGKDSRQQLRILDIRLESSGVSLAEDLRESTLRIQRDVQAKKAGKSLPPNHLGAIRKAFETQGPAAAIDVIRKLPREAKQGRQLANVCLALVSKYGDRVEIQKEVQDFVQLHPQGKTMVEFVLLQNCMKSQQWDEALVIVNRLGLKLHDDPFLNVVRARIQLNQGKVAEAEKAARIAQKQEAKLAEAYEVLVQLAVQKQDFNQAVDWLSLAHKELPEIHPNFAGRKEFKAFLASPAFQKWESRQLLNGLPNRWVPRSSHVIAFKTRYRHPQQLVARPRETFDRDTGRPRFRNLGQSTHNGGDRKGLGA